MTKIIETHIRDVRIGDSVICSDGFERTVGRNDLKYSEFMGISLFGDTYKLGRTPVPVIANRA